MTARGVGRKPQPTSNSADRTIGLTQMMPAVRFLFSIIQTPAGLSESSHEFTGVYQQAVTNTLFGCLMIVTVHHQVQFTRLSDSQSRLRIVDGSATNPVYFAFKIGSVKGDVAKTARHLSAKPTISVVVSKHDVNRAGEVLPELGDHERGTEITGVNEMGRLLRSSLLQSPPEIVQTIVAVGE